MSFFIPESNRENKAGNKAGFTLIELFIGIGIVSILATLVLIFLNPAEQLKRARDSRRIDDLSNLKSVLSQVLADNVNLSLAPANKCSGESSSTIFVSVPSDNGESDLSNLPSGWTYSRVIQANLRKTDSSGWLPVIFPTSSNAVSFLPVLPIDPKNSFADNLFYSYACKRSTKSYELNARLESQKYSPRGDSDKITTDAGDDSYVYEIGNDLKLDPLAALSSWSFNEATGTIAYDNSINAKNGSVLNMADPPTGTSGWQVNNCKQGACLAFDGSNDGVRVVSPPQLSSLFTVLLWVNPSSSLGVNDDFIGVWNTSGWLFRSSISSGSDRLEFYNGSVNYTAGASTLITGAWQQVAASFDGSAYRLYRNGVLVYTSGSGQVNPVNNSDMWIGRLPAVSYEFPGLIDEVSIYSRNLTAKEIEQQYNATK